MRNELGKEVRLQALQCLLRSLGLSNVPSAGDEATVVRDEKKHVKLPCIVKVNSVMLN